MSIRGVSGGFYQSRPSSHFGMRSLFKTIALVATGVIAGSSRAYADTMNSSSLNLTTFDGLPANVINTTHNPTITDPSLLFAQAEERFITDDFNEKTSTYLGSVKYPKEMAALFELFQEMPFMHSLVDDVRLYREINFVLDSTLEFNNLKIDYRKNPFAQMIISFSKEDIVNHRLPLESQFTNLVQALNSANKASLMDALKRQAKNHQISKDEFMNSHTKIEHESKLRYASLINQAISEGYIENVEYQMEMTDRKLFAAYRELSGQTARGALLFDQLTNSNESFTNALPSFVLNGSKQAYARYEVYIGEIMKYRFSPNDEKKDDARVLLGSMIVMNKNQKTQRAKTNVRFLNHFLTREERKDCRNAYLNSSHTMA